jgi:caffeoyl-CoA O-methyltransferase
MSMVRDPYAYFRRWLPERSELLLSLEREAHREGIPIIGPAAGQLLYLLARLSRACRIVELGTAIAYSTIFLGLACRHTGGRVISFESDKIMAARARANIERTGLSEHVEVRCDDALQSLAQWHDPVQMFFLDIEKEDYVTALSHCARLLPSDGLLVVDNTGFEASDAFNRAINGDSQWQVVNLWTFLPGHSPEQDGICLALKT